METQTSEPDGQSEAAAGGEGGEKSAGGGGGSREPGEQGRKRGRGARRRESPARHSRPPFPHRALQVLVSPPPRARARQTETRSPDPPLKRPLREAPVPVRAALPPLVRARAPARPQAPRGPRHVTAPSQGGSGGRASIGSGGRGSGSSCAASVEREAWRCGEEGSVGPERVSALLPLACSGGPAGHPVHTGPCPELAVAP